ncbi:hypothetical protein D3C85_1206020 [compost metagenome]|jgi:hypothetical protein
MRDESVIKEVKDEVFSQQDIKLSEQDPLFTLIIANQRVLDNFSRPFTQTLKEMPGAISDSLNRLVSAVEDAEGTAEKLMANTQASLKSLAKDGVELAALQVQRKLEYSVVNTLANANLEIQEIEKRVKSISSNYRDPKAMTINIVLAGVIATLLLIFSAGLYVLYDRGMESREAADYWYKKHMKQERAIDGLPAIAKKKILDELKSD